MKKSDQIALIGMPSWGVNQPFHSLAIVAGVVREAGFAVTLHDLNIEFYRQVDEEDRKWWEEDNTDLWKNTDLSRELWEKHTRWLHDRLDTIFKDTDTSLIGFSVNSYNRYFSIRGAKYLKSKRPDIPIMFGGVDCFPGEVGKALLSSREDRHCDIICRGECEIALKKYLENFRETGSWKTSIQGFAFYDAGALVDTGDTELPGLTEKQPLPAFDLFDLSAYTDKGSLPFYLSRGCVYRCNFCSERPNFRKYRCRNAEEAVEELKTIIPLARKLADPPNIHLSDSIVNANPKMLEQFVDLIIESGIGIQWGGQGHIHRLLTYEFLEKMKRSGFVSVFWGIESGSQHVVDLMNKKYSWTDARRVLNDCSKLGIVQHIPIVLGFPGETPEDVVDTLEFIFTFQDKPLCNIHTPRLIVVRPKSPLFERYSEFELADNSFYDWSTTDQTNTLSIRIVRRFVASQAQGNRELSAENLVDMNEIAHRNLNAPGVSYDLFCLVHEAFLRADRLESFYSAIETWKKSVPWIKRCYRFLIDMAARVGSVRKVKGVRVTPFADKSANGNQERIKHLRRWNRLEKSGPNGREHVHGIILDALRALRREVGQNALEEQQPAIKPGN